MVSARPCRRKPFGRICECPLSGLRIEPECSSGLVSRSIPPLPIAPIVGILRLRFLTSVTVVAVVLAAASAAPAAGYVPGIDVSAHQGAIAWDQVAASGERFVFLKATEGITFDDPLYAQNKLGAQRAGLRVGAYHFARPDGRGDAARRDARREARHFLAVAGLGSGNLLPVLDIEVDGGLGKRALKTWTRAWLRKVRLELGVRGVIYTMPYFWRTAMGDTRWFARHGYKTLWIAHWETSSPDVPAQNWNGEGWTFWQWTDSGTVPGISGYVDRNHFRGRWRSVTIP